MRNMASLMFSMSVEKEQRRKPSPEGPNALPGHASNGLLVEQAQGENPLRSSRNVPRKGMRRTLLLPYDTAIPCR